MLITGKQRRAVSYARSESGEVGRGPSKKRKLREVHTEERRIKCVQGLLASEEVFSRV
jgi:hypothetical protein